MTGRTPSLLLLVTLLATATLRSQEAPEVGSVETLSWLTGCWRQSGEGRVFEECWLEPDGGMLLGVNRMVDDEGGTFFEFLRIADSDSGPVYWASPLGREAVPFRAVSSGPKSMTFVNPEHDFPQRIEYALDEAGRLHARISGLEDEAEGPEWIYQKVGPTWE